ncbi:MAG TPA: MurR/RpiR family transcriptional regulator [Bauldia sp.]|nr:MurR/RpiR family transcriptional regulator [Bauldia sp.]
MAQRSKVSKAVSKATAKASVPDHYERIVNLIADEYSSLSGRFQQIARFFTQNPNVVALESINAISAQCGADPSSLVRFAQRFGYSGFKELQAVFRTRLATAAPGFRERISALEVELSRNVRDGKGGHLKDLVVRDIAALQGLLETVSEDDLNNAGHLLEAADTIYIAGQLRSAPIASFLRYLMTMLRRRVILLDPAGGLALEMASSMTKRDALVAIAFRHYAKEVVSITELAATNGTPMIAITDSLLSPIAKNARTLFTVPEDEYTFSRSIAAPMCLVQCIGVVTAGFLQPHLKSGARIPTVTEVQRQREQTSRQATRPRSES